MDLLSTFPKNWETIDRQNIWHPYSSMLTPLPMYPVSSAKGVYLQLATGQTLIDGMASWWSAIHGYQHPDLDQAILDQMSNMSHVMFGGLTHEPAIRLAKQLIDITCNKLQHVFFADSGSIAVEVAIKMALQYWYAQGKAEKNKLLTVRRGYHGDTFATMGVCDPVTGMHQKFSGALNQHFFADAPQCQPSTDNPNVITTNIATLQQQLEQHQHHIAAVIIEPIVQGAGGMRFYCPEYLQQLRQLCDHYHVLLIFDEIATGFGRTGTLFAYEQAGIEPDIMTVGKALTGGYMTLAATLASTEVAEGISADGEGVLMHGPTFMANPLACSVANASIRLLLNSPWQQRIQHIEKQLETGLAPCKQLCITQDVRVKGAIGVVELKQAVDMAWIQPQFVEQGVWVRPFGKLVYIMPPYIINDDELAYLTAAMVTVLQQMATLS